MNTPEHFVRMFTYDGWANRECIAALRRAGASSATVGRMAHILSAEKLWLERIRREPQSLAVWPSSAIEECAALADHMSTQWRGYLEKLAEAEFGQTVEYRNSKGEPWSNRVEDILTHVLMHAAYHRGQIALEMRVAGAEPAYTDFIHAVRQGFLE